MGDLGRHGPGRAVVGLGLAAVGRPAYITPGRDRDLGTSRTVEELEADARTLLDAAYAAGVRHVDCARSYGLAERFLGGWRLDADVHEVKDHALAAFERQLAETRAELGGRLDVYQVHSLTPDSPALEDRALHGRLAALRDSGVVVGFSTSGPRQADVVRQALALEMGGAPLFGLVQSTWNLLEPSAGPALAEASGAGVRVVVKEAVANGRLTGAEDDPAPGVRDAARLAADLGAPLDQVAVAAVLAQPWASVVLSGAVTVDQLRSNLAAAALDVPPDRLEALLARAEEPESYWRARSQRAWA